MVEISILVTAVVEDSLQGERTQVLEPLERQGVFVGRAILAVSGTCHHSLTKGGIRRAGLHFTNQLAALGPNRVVFAIRSEKGRGNRLGRGKAGGINEDFASFG